MEAADNHSITSGDFEHLQTDGLDVVTEEEQQKLQQQFHNILQAENCSNSIVEMLRSEIAAVKKDNQLCHENNNVLMAKVDSLQAQNGELRARLELVELKAKLANEEMLKLVEAKIKEKKEMLVSKSNNIMLLLLGILFFAFPLFNINIQPSTAMFTDDQNSPLLISSSSAICDDDEKGKQSATTGSSFVGWLTGGIENGFMKWSYKHIGHYEVSLASVKLVQWENEPGKKIRHSCDAEIVHDYYFRFNWKKEQCNWVKRDGKQLLSLQVEYKLYTDCLKRTMFDASLAIFTGHMANPGAYYEYSGHICRKRAVRYDLWKSELFPADIVAHWLQGKGGHFWLDHNCMGWVYTYPMLFEHEHPHEVVGLVKPGAKCDATTGKMYADEHNNNNRRHPVVMLSSVKLVKREDEWAEKQVVSTSCVAEIVEEEPSKFIFNWKECLAVSGGGSHSAGSSRQNVVDGRFFSLHVEYKYSYEKEERGGQQQHATTNHVRYYDLWNTEHFPVATVKRWLQGKGDTFVFDHNCAGQQFFEQQEKQSEGEVLCLAKPGAKCPMPDNGRAYQQVFAKNPFDFSKYPRIEQSVVLSSVKLVQWENNAGREVGSRQWEKDAAEGNGIANSSLQSQCVAIIENKNYVHFNWEECRRHFIKDRHGALKPFSLLVEYKYEKNEDAQQEQQHHGTTNNSPEETITPLKPYRYDLWDTDLFDADSVKEWFKGKGQFRLDHNRYPGKLFLPFMVNKPPKDMKQGWCLVKPLIRAPDSN